MLIFSDADISKYRGANSYDKGHDCLSFIKTVAQDGVLFGLYAGSVGIYHVNVHFDTQGITDSGCTCLAIGQYDSTCKHIAGLLILWKSKPSKFVRLESWQILLAHLEREDMINLIVDATKKSIEATNAFYEAFKGEPFLEPDDLFTYFD